MHPNHTKLIFTGIHLVLIAACAYLVVKGTYTMLINRVENHPLVQSNPISASNVSSSRASVASEYDNISQRNIFSTNDGLNEPVQASSPNVPEKTRLDLKLWGTVTGITDRPYAVIEDGQTRRQKLYRKGDRIQGARVSRILRDSVVLTFNGEDRMLAMESPTSSYVAAGAQPSPSADREAIPTQKISVEREQINSALENANQLLKQVNVRPHSTNGRPDGFIVSRIAPDSIFRRMGLRNGDIISGVNGEDLRTMEDALRLYRDLSGADNVDVQIKRRGRPQVLQYNIR